MQEEYKGDGICEDGWDGGVHGGHASQKLVQRRITVHSSVSQAQGLGCGGGENGRTACVARVRNCLPAVPVKGEVNAAEACAWRTKKNVCAERLATLATPASLFGGWLCPLSLGRVYRVFVYNDTMLWSSIDRWIPRQCFTHAPIVS